MNILPKKRWHVRNQDNKERVRKDEENARLEQKREEERILLAEQEARLSLLRKKHGSINVTGENIHNVAVHQKQEGHINLFSIEEEANTSANLHNEDYIKEKKKDKEDYEKKIGLLTYLGQSAAEAKDKTEQPWYLDKHTVSIEKTNSSDAEKDELKKHRLDPLSIVESSLKKHKDKKKKKKKIKEKDDSPNCSSSKLSIAKLREQRLKREKVEKEKSIRLLQTLSGEEPEKRHLAPESDPTRYSNQFNPALARKRRYDQHKKH